ncbi:MAG: hypothetical protein WDO19_28390 [Bacteroidota bacterium]
MGSQQGTSEFYIYDRNADTVLFIKTDSLPGIKDLPDYVKDYPKQLEEQTKNPPLRTVTVYGPYWSPKGTHAVLDIFSTDNKDRWLMLLNASTGKLKLLDRQHDNAWIGGPGIGWGLCRRQQRLDNGRRFLFFNLKLPAIRIYIVSMYKAWKEKR